ncbi:MAG: 4-hydroxy-3-methylbut-2-enyl diphosphate reductase, partial [Clostridiales bacterium]|nr:4-hydroxy-3-methylbut-2-enyl diphosphate reductase [Clostridiales bacterium]
MKIILSPNSGFCFGVKRAVDKVYKAIDTRDDIYTLGPIIHNPQVVGDLADKGVNILKNIDDIEDGTVVIRSHGIGHTEYENLKFKNLDLIDATCPYVKRIHKIVQKHWNMGYDIIVIGEADHPEVMGINGWCNNESHVIYSANDIENLPNIDRACVVAQTTILQSKWDDLVAKLHTNIKDLKVFNTRCNATHIRQEAAKQLAAKVDIMIVIGGKNSSNTHKLYQLCKERCENTFAIESAKDINKNMLDAGEIVGVTAGASTPIWLIEEVVETMES